MIKIAVAIPTYQRLELLLALTQSLPADVPICVSDNDSSLSGQNSKFGNNVTLHHAERLLPIFSNWNRAVSFIPSDTTHVVIPSDDDLYLPNALQSIFQSIEKYPNADMLIFGCDLVDEHGNTWKGWQPKHEQLCPPGEGFLEFEHGVDARMPGVVFRTDFFRRIGGFDERFELTASDSEMIQRATLLGSTAFIPSVIGKYRVWTGSLTFSRQATDLWLNEVDYWTGKIADLLRSGHQPKSRKVNVDRFRDEIFANNLLAGLSNLRKKGEFEKARTFFAAHPAPRNISLRTHLRFLKMRWALRDSAL